MAFVPSDGVVEVAINFDQQGIPITNVLHFWPNGAPAGPLSAADVAAVLSDVLNAWDSTILTEQSQDINMTGGRARDLTVANGVTVDGVSLGTGGRAEAAEPPGVAAVVSWKTGLAGPSRRGRTFLAGVDENHTAADGSLDVSYRTDLQTQVDAFGGLVDGSGTNPVQVVLSQYHMVGGVLTPRAAGIATQVIQGTVRNFVHSQRRRNRRG